MFPLEEIGDVSLKSLLEKLEAQNFILESGDESIISDQDLAEAWDHYYEDFELAPIYLETMFGFVFERE